MRQNIPGKSAYIRKGLNTLGVLADHM